MHVNTYKYLGNRLTKPSKIEGHCHQTIDALAFIAASRAAARVSAGTAKRVLARLAIEAIAKTSNVRVGHLELDLV
jgi:hypothetical protein